MRRRIWRTTLWTGWLSVAACAAPPEPVPPQVIWTERAWRDLDLAKEAARAVPAEPRVVHFPGHGEITVRRWELEGSPGETWVRAGFTYQNTTGRDIDHVTVWLTVLDADGRPVARQSTDLFMPTSVAMAPGTLFADELRTQTRGLYRDPRGWKWALGCHAVFSDGAPAAAEYPGEPWVSPSHPYSSWVTGR